MGISFTAVDGRKVDLSSMHGKVILVDFWATWCPPCLAALPQLKAEHEKYRAKGLEVICVSWDHDLGKLKSFVSEHELQWPQYFVGPRRHFGESLGIGGIPYVLLIDKQGRLRAATAFPERPTLSDLVSKLLAE